MSCARIRMSVGPPRWTWRSRSSTACWNSDARITSALPDPGRGWGQCAHSPDPCNTATQAPEHHEGDDIGRVLRPVQQGAGALIELFATGPAAEPAIALGGALRPLGYRLRPTFQAPHLRPPLC